MEIQQIPNITEQEIAEVIDLINELHQEESSRSQAMALCRSVADLVSTPELALHGILKLIEGKQPEDLDQANSAMSAIAGKHKHLRWLQFRCGHHFQAMGRHQQSVDCFLGSIALKPTLQAHHQAAIGLKKLMQFEQSIEHFEKALEKNPAHIPSRSELLYLMAMKGNLQRFKELDEAGAMQPAHLANCYNRLGQTLVYFGDARAAIDWFDKAVEIQPDSFSFQWSKHLTVPTIYHHEQDLIQSRQRYLKGLHYISDLFDQLPVAEKNQSHRCAEKLTNFEIHYQSENDMEVQQIYGALFHKIMAHCMPQFMRPMERRHPQGSRRIRVGFVSWGCFFTHSNYKTHGSWLTGLDQNKFEVFGYPLAPNQDRTTERMKTAVEHYIPLGASVAKLRSRIVADKLDILVYPGIGMEPLLHRFAPLRLAPVQCTSWGHPVTSGLPNIDYYLSSELMEPVNAQDHYTEKLIRLPNLGISQLQPEMRGQMRAPGIVADRPRPGKLFLCSQNLLKMMPKHDYMFARILQTVSDSEIWFIQSKRKDVTDTFLSRMRAVCQSYGVSFDQRCLMLPRLDKAEFCYVNDQADIMLDTGFWSGCNTTFETLQQRTPVITLPGNTMRGRHTLAILQLHGLQELICVDEQDYIARATTLSTDQAFYDGVCAKIDRIQDKLFGDQTVIAALEDFFEQSLRGEI